MESVGSKVCTAHSHYVRDGNCLCGKIKNGKVDPEWVDFWLESQPPIYRKNPQEPDGGKPEKQMPKEDV